MPQKITLRRIAIVLLSVVSVSLLAWRFYPLTQTSQSPATLSLKVPPFISVARAADTADTDFLQDEAGIAAYTNAGQPLDLNLVKTFFRGIERSTDDYIIGSVAAPGFADAPQVEEQVDPHVYINRDGWIVAYYLNDAPVTKMITWPKYDPEKLTRNNLSDIIKQIFSSFGIQSSAISYYDFQYPNADSLLLITDVETTTNVADIFTLQIPSNITVFQRSWSFAGQNFYNASSCKLNQEVLFTDTKCDRCWMAHYGFLNTLQVPPNTVHTVTTVYERDYPNGPGGAYCAVGLVYKEAP